MKISYGSNFDFVKLLKYVFSEEYGDFSSNAVIAPIVNSAKRNIKKGVGKPLTVLTRKVRKERGISGNTPLYATGSLYDSIKVSDTKGNGFVMKGAKALEMNKYGIYHIKGFKPKYIPYTDEKGNVGKTKAGNVAFRPNKRVKVPSRKFLEVDVKNTGAIQRKIVKKFREKFTRVKKI